MTARGGHIGGRRDEYLAAVLSRTSAGAREVVADALRHDVAIEDVQRWTAQVADATTRRPT
jgi:hypothetical protein